MTSKPRAAWGEVAEKILALLAKRGPLTRSQIVKALGIERQYGGAMMSRLNYKGPQFGKRVYVFRWTWHSTGERRYPRAVYALCVTGDEVDAERPELPPPPDKIVIGRYTHDREKLPHNSIFQVAEKLKKVRKTTCQKKASQRSPSTEAASSKVNTSSPTKRRKR